SSLSSRRRHTMSKRDWSSDVCSSDLVEGSHTVLRIAVVDVDVGHVYPVHLVDDVHSLVMEVPSHPCVQLADDGHKLGNHLLQVRSEERRVGKECRAWWGGGTE